uniref:Ent-kaurene synthase n=1 Tax=Oryza barthii TaxID=65489 RepID=A0A0D3G080_9ORYZ
MALEARAVQISLPPDACCFSGGKSSHRMSPATQLVRAPQHAVATAYAEKSLEAGGNAASLPNNMLELVNVVMHQRKAREDAMRKKKKQQQLHKFEMLPSPYNTAWVAMVPLPGSSSQLPCFPQCVEWILQNQQSNGSWDLNQLDSITKDALLSTLACLAAPIGFKITFPGMLSSVIEMGLEVPIGQTDVERVLHLQETELKREYEENYRGRNTYMAYVSEGLGNAQDWNEVMNFQRKNGSLFNSLSITAACIRKIYIANFPWLMRLKIWEYLGILMRDEEVMLDIKTCAMAFRILRMNGYDVSSDDLCHIAEVSDFHSSHQGYLSDTRTLLELYKASEVRVADNEFILDRIGSWSGRLLKEQLSSGALQRTSSIFEEVEHALDCPFYATLDRLVHKRNIEHFAAMSYHMLKTTYLPCQTAQDLVALGARNFSTTQFIYQDELERIDSWVKENRLHELKFARQKSAYFYLSAAGTVFDPEMSDARIWWAINGVLTTVVDDFFDVGGSREELENLISLVEMWDEHHKEFYSEQVEIVFFAIYNSVNQLGAKASAVQGRDVTKHLIEIWLDLLRSMMTEVEWRISNYVPRSEEYMENAAMTFALGPIVLPALYLVGPKIPESVVRDSEYNELFRLMSTCGRLLNDVQTYEREDGEGKVNSVSLLVIQSGGSVSIEEARREIMKPIERCRRELLGLVLRRGSAVPGPCKELFWKMCKVCYFFYSRGDGFSSPTAKSAAVDASDYNNVFVDEDQATKRVACRVSSSWAASSSTRYDGVGRHLQRRPTKDDLNANTRVANIEIISGWDSAAEPSGSWGNLRWLFRLVVPCHLLLLLLPMMMLLLPSSSSSCCCRCPGGQFHGAPPRVMAPRRGVTRVYIEKRLGVGGGNASSLQDMHRKELQARTRDQLQTLELSTSSYDTAWVAMVPLRGSRQHPCFPQCVEWILQNQQDDGSWGTRGFGLAVTRDVLSSTLACVLALKRWNVGQEHIRRGLDFIGRNFSIAMDEQIAAPVGFNITFPGMLSLAMGMDLEFPVRQTDVDRLLHLREIELEREAGDHSYGRKAYMAYVTEGLGNLLEWDEIMMFQRKNGSFFNCPSTTAATLVNHYNDKALQYLNCLVSKFGSAVPTVYPLNIYCQLSWVDALEKMGISQYFVSEIKSILDTTYVSWLERDEEIMLDITTCAMAFRLLRMNGYHVSSVELSPVAEASSFRESLQGYLNDKKSLLELYKASKMKYALKFPFYTTLDRLDHKRNIERFDAKDSQMLKMEYFWVKDEKLDQLPFARQKLTYCYLSAAATIFPRELSEARIAWAKNGVLTTVVDDFFDLGGSKEELENLIALVEKWDGHQEEFYSEQVRIVFSAIYTTVNQLGAKASALQGRDVTKHLTEIWLCLMRSMMTEAEWQRTKYVPTMEEYMANAGVSFALGPIVLPTLYFVGPKLQEDVVRDHEYNELFRLMSTCGRLLNDSQGFERESLEGKLNSVSLLVHHSGGSISIDEAKMKAQKSIDTSRRNLLRLVLGEQGAVPRPCKQLFWKMCKIVHMFYSRTDGFSSPKEMVSAVNAVVKEPLKLKQILEIDEVTTDVSLLTGTSPRLGANYCPENIEPAAFMAIEAMRHCSSSSSEEGGAAATTAARSAVRERLQLAPPSPYDMAWRNQRGDGSWRHAAAAHQQLGSSPEIVTERDLSSTLACVLALARWDAGSEHVRRGLQFIGRNMSVAMDDQTAAPASGSVVSFAAMLRMAMEMGLEVPAVSQADVRDRDAGVICHGGRTEYTAYVSEGLGNIQNWNEVMKFQRKNGSLFNSPYTTAAALVHNYDAKALQYLDMLLDKFGSAVPAAYPANIQSQLYMVDVLEKMGISRHFVGEIKSILDMTYSCWKQRDEEIVLDMQTCGMAFRMLRMNGYDVSSDELSHFSEPSSFHNSLQGYLNDTKSLLELHKASKVSIAEKEVILDNIGSWTGCLLKEQLLSSAMKRNPLSEEVEYALEFPFYTMLDRLDHKRNIEHFDITSSQMLETAYLPCHSNEEIMALGVRDFSSSQFIFQEELQQLNSWVKESRLDQLQFARQKLDYFYFSAAATIFTPELSDVRILWAKNGVLTTVVDDFFDVGGSKEELENLVALVEKWDKNDKTEYYSEQVEIVFSAIYTSTNQLGSMASVVQGRDVTKHLVEIWQELLRSMMTEVEWRQSRYVPTAEEYMENAVVTFALGPVVLPALYLVGPKIPDSVIRSQECSELFRLMSKCGRLLNDVQSYEREGSQGKLNSVSLLALHSGGSVSMEEAVKQIQRPIEKCRRELLKLVVSRGGAVPRPCRELFWSMCKVCHFFYSGGDGFSSPTAKAGAVDAVIHEPLNLSCSV